MPRPPPPQKPPLKQTHLKGVRNPPPIRRRSTATKASGTSNTNPSSTTANNSRTCPNPACPEPKVEDLGDKRVCTSCGTVVSDSNIVSEVQFGETSAGAAVVQGTFVGADQSHARIQGTKFKRAGGMESREVAEANGLSLLSLG